MATEAWTYIIQNWGCVNWTALPQWVKTALNLHSALGICGGMLITRHSAEYMGDFITRMNRKRG